MRPGALLRKRPLSLRSRPAGIPSGLSLYMHFAIADSAAPVGVALSNAISGTAP
jgi:hypothetical protein